MAEIDKLEHFTISRKRDGSLWDFGRGAMGVTYKALDTNLQWEVALKVISSQSLDSEPARQRFLREARAAASLRHPSQSPIFLTQEGYGWAKREVLYSLTLNGTPKGTI
jgi:serine/threonine protein kinase